MLSVVDSPTFAFAIIASLGFATATRAEEPRAEAAPAEPIQVIVTISPVAEAAAGVPPVSVSTSEEPGVYQVYDSLKSVEVPVMRYVTSESIPECSAVPKPRDRRPPCERLPSVCKENNLTVVYFEHYFGTQDSGVERECRSVGGHFYRTGGCEGKDVCEFRKSAPPGKSLEFFHRDSWAWQKGECTHVQKGGSVALTCSVDTHCTGANAWVHVCGKYAYK